MTSCQHNNRCLCYSSIYRISLTIPSCVFRHFPKIVPKANNSQTFGHDDLWLCSSTSINGFWILLTTQFHLQVIVFLMVVFLSFFCLSFCFIIYRNELFSLSDILFKLSLISLFLTQGFSRRFVHLIPQKFRSRLYSRSH